MKLDAKSTIEAGKAILGIELGSTRIKAVLIDQENKPIAQGSHTWENQLVDGLWTYSVEAVWYGLQDCYADLRANVKSLYDTEIETLAAIGVSAIVNTKIMEVTVQIERLKQYLCEHVELLTDEIGRAHV